MIFTISYNNELIEGYTFNEMYAKITSNKSLIMLLIKGEKYTGYREGNKILEIGLWYIENRNLMYRAISKQYKNKDGNII